MSASALAPFGSAPVTAAKQIAIAGHEPPKTRQAARRFREDLGREHRLEATRAGLSRAQVSEYASTLNWGMEQIPSDIVPLRLNWFYQSPPHLVRRTILAGRLELAQAGNRKPTGRIAAGRAPILASGFRWWNESGDV